MGIEIERKFRLKYNPCRAAEPADHIVQGYIKKNKKAVVRVRTCNDLGFLTIKGEKTRAAGLEFEYEIPLEDARALLENLCHRPVIEKDRYHLTHKGTQWVIDVFSSENKGLEIAEVELSSRDQAFEKPDWIGKEVTGDPDYYNTSLTDRPFTTWPKDRRLSVF